MRIRIVCLCGMAALALTGLPAHATSENERAVRKELEARYARVVEAYRRKDIAAFMADKTPDFTGRSLSGKMGTREQVEAGVKQRMERILRLNYLRIRIHKLTVRGDQAEAITSQEFSRVVADPQGREHTVVGKGTMHRDTWVRTADGWKMKRVEELKQGHETVDGQLVRPQR